MALRLALLLSVALTLGATDYDTEIKRIDTELASATGAKRAYLLYLRASLTTDFEDFRAAEVAVDESELLLVRANLHFKLHRLDAAKRDLEAAGGSAALEADIAMQEGRYDDARRMYEALPPKWDNLARLAFFRSKMGDAVAADKLYERAADELTAKEMRDFAWIELQRGVLDLERGRVKDALAHYERANAAWSGWWLIDEHRAEALHLLGRTEEAVALYRDVIARTKKPELISALAAILESEELFAEADRRFEEEMALYPEAAVGHYIDHLLSRGGDVARVVELAERNHAARPNAEAKLLLAKAYRNAKRIDDAKKLEREVRRSGWRAF